MSHAPDFDPTLYLVTDPDLTGGRPLLEIVLEAVAGGVTLVQLRDKRADGRALLEAAHALKAALDPLGVPLIVNDRVDVARAAGAGCHLGQTDLPPAVARELLGPDPILGVSIDAPEQTRAADPELLDYVAHGPFAVTATKADAGTAVAPAGIAAVRFLTALPLVAIGGIDVANAGAAITAGADGIAVVSAILTAVEPATAAAELRAAIAAGQRRGERR